MIHLNSMRRQFAFHAMCYLTPLVIATSCGRKKHHDDDQPAPQPTPQLDPALTERPMDAETKRWWINKANATLRLNEPMDDAGFTPEELEKLENKEVVAKLTSDGAFYDMMADFTSYWFGTKVSGLRETERIGTTESDGYLKQRKISVINNQLASQLPVVNAVKSMAKGGDYWNSLFQEKGSQYLTDIADVYLYTPESENKADNKPKTPAETRLMTRDQLHKEWSKSIQLLTEGKHDEFCTSWENNSYYSLGGPKVPNEFFADSLLSAFPLRFFVSEHCKTNSNALIDDAKALQQLTVMNARLDNVVETLNRMDFETRFKNTHPRAVAHVVDLAELDLTEAGESKEQPLYNSTLFSSIQNSSTNRNRRRAAWVLKRFFCDDLTPLNIDAPSSHVGGQHGSDPACYSCHYKLDPMAGYFREIGFFGKSFASEKKILFDDGATADRETYEKPWHADPSTGRTWNIGYIRSLTDDSKNTFGANFSDLLALLRTAPEVKECFVRRAFEYVVGEEQAFDKTWGRSVTNRMNETAKTNPTLAIKQMFAEIVMSKAYLARERNNNICYDMEPGTDSKNRAPCRIAAILERNCTSCHSATNRQGGLDLSSWKILGDQKAGFNHTRDGKNVDGKETLQNIMDRINASDANVRMPLMRTMPAAERQELFLWLQKEITKY